MSASKVPGKASAILQLTCPRCRQGKLFHTPTTSFRRPFDMKDHCEVCELDFMPEPGFYYGSMYVSYMFVGGFSLVFIAVFHWVFGWSMTASFAALIAIVAIFMVYIFRLSRSFWLGVHVKYRPETRNAK